MELAPSAGTEGDGLGGTEESGIPGTVSEASIPELEETTLLERAGDCVGRLAAGSVGLKKTVETTVIVTGSLASGCVGCGVPFGLIEESEGEGEPVGGEPTSGVEDGSSDKVGRGRETEVEEGLTEDPPEALERVTLFPSNSASLRARPECPSPATYRAHKIPEQGFLAPKPAKGAVITRPTDAARAKIINDLKAILCL